MTSPTQAITIKEPYDLRTTLATMKAARSGDGLMRIWDQDIEAVKKAIAIIEAIRALNGPRVDAGQEADEAGRGTPPLPLPPDADPTSHKGTSPSGSLRDRVAASPTQAQIEAAAKASYEANYNDFPWESLWMTTKGITG